MVIHVASEVLESIDVFDEIMEEIAVLALLGVRPVLLVGTRAQVDASLELRANEPVFHGGVRETDESTMRVVQEGCGDMRSRVEGALARGRSRSGPGGSVGSNVVGGNFFYTAQPVGVRDGIDFGFTGEVRSFDVGRSISTCATARSCRCRRRGTRRRARASTSRPSRSRRPPPPPSARRSSSTSRPHQLVVRSDVEALLADRVAPAPADPGERWATGSASAPCCSQCASPTRPRSSSTSRARAGPSRRRPTLLPTGTALASLTALGENCDVMLGTSASTASGRCSSA